MASNKITFLKVGFACDFVRQDAYGQWIMAGILNPVNYYDKFPIEYPIGKHFCAVANVACDEKFSALIDVRLVDEEGNKISECFNQIEFNGCQDGMIIPLCYLEAQIQKPKTIILEVKLENETDWNEIQKFEFRQSDIKS